MPTYERLDYGSVDGSQWGGSSTTDLLAFYGVTPVSRYNITSLTSAFPASTFPSSLGGGAGSSFGFMSSAHFTSLIAQVSSIQAALTRYGLMS